MPFESNNYLDFKSLEGFDKKIIGKLIVLLNRILPTCS